MRGNDKVEKPAACVRAAEAVAFVRGGMPEAERAAFEAHMRECEACRALTADFGDVVGVLGDRPAVAFDSGFSARTMARLREEEAGHRSGALLRFRPVPWHRVAGVAAGLLLAVGSFLCLWRVARPAGMAVSGGARQDQAIASALAWLAGDQLPSGAWDSAKWQGRKEYEVALSGMALLTFLRQTRSAGAHAGTVQRAVAYLVGQQEASGAFGPACDGRMYNHGIATVALVEAYRRTGAEALRAPLGRALAFIGAEQLDSGGWSYAKRVHAEANTSISVWQLYALNLAAQAGLSDSPAAYGRGARWLRGVVDGNGLFGYERAGDFPNGSDTLTAMGAFCLFGDRGALGAEPAEAVKIEQALRSVAANWNKETDFYRWFFLAHAIQASGTPELRASLARIQESLLGMRSVEGVTAGTWDPKGAWSSVGGRLYTTAMATLALEAGSSRASAL
jgi:hypothetical protein